MFRFFISLFFVRWRPNATQRNAYINHTREEWSPKYGWRTAKRPGLDEFLKRLCQRYEIVLFSETYANTNDTPFQIDPYGCITHRLYRDSTRFLKGRITKDLSLLNRDLARVIIIDDKKSAFRLQTDNGIPIVPYVQEEEEAEAQAAADAAAGPQAKAATGAATSNSGNLEADQPVDRELLDLIPFLEAIVENNVEDVRPFLDHYKKKGQMFRKAVFEKELQTKIAIQNNKAKENENNKVTAFLPSGAAADISTTDKVGMTSRDMMAVFRREIMAEHQRKQQEKSKGLGGAIRRFGGTSQAGSTAAGGGVFGWARKNKVF